MIRNIQHDRARHGIARTTVLRGAVLAALALVLVIPAAGYGGQAKQSGTQASCQLQVFSWWTGGGEAAGLRQPAAGMELEADAVATLDNSLRGRVPAERRPGRVGEEGQMLVRPLPSGCRGDERAAEHDCGEQGDRATHGAAL